MIQSFRQAAFSKLVELYKSGDCDGCYPAGESAAQPHGAAGEQPNVVAADGGVFWPCELATAQPQAAESILLTGCRLRHYVEKENQMPLKKSTSKKAFEDNLKAELAAGKPKKQALAISYATKRAAAKKKKR